MCIGCEVSNAAGGISALSALLATTFPVAGVVVLKFTRFFSLKKRAGQKGYYWKLGLLLAGYHVGIALTLALVGLSLANAPYSKVVVASGLLMYILLWIWFSWVIARNSKQWQIHTSFVLTALGLVPFILLYLVPYLLLSWGLTHQLFLLRPILPDYSFLNLFTGFLSLFLLPGLIKVFQKLLGGPA